jgi:prepilin-type N-terminal cleavage/methylation domain-containing protein
MLKKRNQKGFTLIEIIAVLVILGILAAVAIPKYFDLQTDSRQKAVLGASSALISTAAMQYSQALLNASASATSFTPNPTTGIVVGDFTGNIAGSAGTYSASVTAGPTGYTAADLAAGTKSFKLF